MTARCGWAPPRARTRERRTKTTISTSPATLRIAAVKNATANPNVSATRPPAAGPTKSPTRWIPAITVIARPRYATGHCRAT